VNSTFFGELLQSISDRGRSLIDRARDRRGNAERRSADLIELCEELLSGRGEASGVALETAKSGIRVNAVAPGPTDTGMLTRFTGTPENKAALVTTVPMGRLGLSEELANAIVFIASDEASYITGHILNVDGGKTAN
jgi:Enoyl-(Acyl carrier protein) reductase